MIPLITRRRTRRDDPLRGWKDPDPQATAVRRQAAALCLRNPGPELLGNLGLLRRALDEHPGEPSRLLTGLLDHCAAADPYELAAHYVEVFDRRNRRSLYLTWWTDGDTRNRGASLVEFKEYYRAHGLEHHDEELPDHLPAVLEFAAATGDPGTRLLTRHRAALRALHTELERAGTPYAAAVEAAAATLPPEGPS